MIRNNDLYEELWQLVFRKERELDSRYNCYSLLTNSTSIASDRYENMDGNIQINTMGGVPNEFRNSVEMITLLNKEQILNFYKNEAITVISSDYFVKTISLIDALLEDIYEVFLRYTTDLNEGEISKKINFGQGGLPEVLLDYFEDYEQHKSQQNTNLKDYLLQYSFYRQYRHAIVHTENIIEGRNERKLKTIIDEINERMDRIIYDMNSLPYVTESRKVTPDITLIMHMEMFRKQLTSGLQVEIAELKEE
ncbi:hypothetical protein [Rummeliibacillus pycnus]|uniref:hypothetical protein n=1 Tax=Rummeliibacillus pycnus TaxID=101070 RepID=UPI000C9D0D05|nr:hypothetical protein [Rummeliibacillus pycnus]